jgi:hypothetical protein
MANIQQEIKISKEKLKKYDESDLSPWQRKKLNEYKDSLKIKEVKEKFKTNKK